MRAILAVAAAVLFTLTGVVTAAPLATENRSPDGAVRTFGWQDRQYPGSAGRVVPESPGDAGAGAGTGDAGAAAGNGSDSGGEGTSPK